AVLPGRVARQQHLAFELDDGGQHRRRVVPVREAARPASQALLPAAILMLAGQRQRRGAAWTEPESFHHAGNHPVDRERSPRPPPTKTMVAFSTVAAICCATQHAPAAEMPPKMPSSRASWRHMSSASDWLT